MARACRRRRARPNQKLAVAGAYGLAAGREKEGIERLWRLRNFPIATVWLVQHLVYRERFDEAAEAALFDPLAAPALTMLVEAVQSPEGSEARARGLELVSTLDSIPIVLGGGTEQPAWLIFFGQPDVALDLLEEKFEGHPIGVEVLWMPMYDPIRDDPRFQAIIRGLGRPE